MQKAKGGSHARGVAVEDKNPVPAQVALHFPVTQPAQWVQTTMYLQVLPALVHSENLYGQPCHVLALQCTSQKGVRV